MAIPNEEKRQILTEICDYFNNTKDYHKLVLNNFDGLAEVSEESRRIHLERLNEINQKYEILLAALEPLSIKERSVLYGRFFLKKSYKEICAELFISRSTYNRLLNSALTKFEIPDFTIQPGVQDIRKD